MKHKNKKRLIFSISLVLLLILYSFKNVAIFLRVLAAFAGIVSFYIFDHYFDMKFKEVHYFLIIIFAFFGILLSPLYSIYPIYDKILHLSIPIFVGVIMFYIVDKQKMTFKWKLLITGSFVVLAITSFEVIEYFLDMFWNLKLQGVYIRDITGLEKFNLVMDKNDDTMIDLILGMFGSLIFVVGKLFFSRK